MRHRLRSLAERADERMHHLGWSPRWLCELSDLSYGAPIDSFGYPDLPREERMACRPARFLWRLIGDENQFDELIYDSEGWFYLVDVHGSPLDRFHDRKEAERVRATMDALGDEVGIVHISAPSRR